ncbi:MAG TPA: glycosyltransferase [Bryobacteraceae bacterium]|nr:glycosyltransferase [Bryobacteraceae bacterium]
MTISVIIPTARDSDALAPLLEALRAQVCEAPFEVIVVNDRPATRRKDAPFARVLRGEGKGPARARNLGAAHAGGTFLLFLDDDVMVDRFYLARVWREIEARPECAVSGAQLAVDRNNSFSLAAEWMLHLFVDGEGSRFAASNALALRRRDFQRVGGFDPSFPLAAGEDREFCARWVAAGFQIVTVRDLAIQHQFPQSFASLARQQWRYGRGAFHFQNRAHGEGPRIRGAHYYWPMFAEARRRYGWSRGSRVGILCWISQGILACGYLRERWLPAARTPSFEETYAE